MKRYAWCAVVMMGVGTTGAAQKRPQTVPLTAGMVVTNSVRIAPGRYRMAAPISLDSALLTIRGTDITVDLTGVYLEGVSPDSAPDQGRGVAIRVEGGRNVHVIGAHARGYRVGLLARGTRGLVLTNLDVSYNWKPRLFSVIEHESLVDWLSFHHNEKGEWLRFGAGLYLDGVHGGSVRGNRAVQGMNGLMLTNCDSLEITDNEFSFNSGLGIGLYRSTWNRILHNRVDYNVRGYSHGFFRRGQDSAGLLMFEQSSHNIVAWNSVTHGGDGLFLWAGQSTMDTGDGGANDNLYFENDFSFAPTNGMEATFSRNDFIGNRIEGSDHGLWGGYSFSSRVIGNCFAQNRIGIAIEHGQDNVIARNRFDGDSLALYLWANAIEPSDWGYPKHRDTKSRDYRVTGNAWAGNHDVMKVQNTTFADSSGNIAATAAPSSCSATSLLGADYLRFAPSAPLALRTIPSSTESRRKRSAIIVDEWGPFDWKSPKLWPVDSARAEPLRLAVLGPPGRWRVVEARGIAPLVTRSGAVGDTIAITPVSSGTGRDWQVTLEYRGAATTSSTGTTRAVGAPYRFSFGRFEPALKNDGAAPASGWAVRFFRWSDSTAKELTPEALTALFRTTPLLTRTEPRLDYEWYRPAIRELPTAHYALQASATVELEPGRYTLRTISDDAVRVWVDGALAIDHLAPHESAVDVTPLAAGRHELRVEYYQVDGWTELRVDIIRGAEQSSGSAGPH